MQTHVSGSLLEGRACDEHERLGRACIRTCRLQCTRGLPVRLRWRVPRHAQFNTGLCLEVRGALRPDRLKKYHLLVFIFVRIVRTTTALRVRAWRPEPCQEHVRYPLARANFITTFAPARQPSQSLKRSQEDQHAHAPWNTHPAPAHEVMHVGFCARAEVRRSALAGSLLKHDGCWAENSVCWPTEK